MAGWGLQLSDEEWGSYLESALLSGDSVALRLEFFNPPHPSLPHTSAQPGSSASSLPGWSLVFVMDADTVVTSISWGRARFMNVKHLDYCLRCGSCQIKTYTQKYWEPTLKENLSRLPFSFELCSGVLPVYTSSCSEGFLFLFFRLRPKYVHEPAYPW